MTYDPDNIAGLTGGPPAGIESNWSLPYTAGFDCNTGPPFFVTHHCRSSQLIPDHSMLVMDAKTIPFPGFVTGTELRDVTPVPDWVLIEISSLNRQFNYHTGCTSQGGCAPLDGVRESLVTTLLPDTFTYVDVPFLGSGADPYPARDIDVHAICDTPYTGDPGNDAADRLIPFADADVEIIMQLSGLVGAAKGVWDIGVRTYYVGSPPTPEPTSQVWVL